MFSISPEGGPGKHRHSGLLQRPLLELATGKTCTLGARKGVEGALGQLAVNAWDLLQPFNQDLAPTSELLPHGDDVVLRSIQGRDDGSLGEGVGTGDAVHHQLDDVLHQWLGQDPIAQPPTRHGVALGQTVQKDGSFLRPGQRCDAYVVTIVDKVFVYLVREDVEVVPLLHNISDDQGLLRTQNGATGVVGRVENDDAGPRVDQGRQLLQVGVLVVLFQEAHRDRPRCAATDHGLENGEAWVRVNNLGILLRQSEDSEEHDRLGTGRDDHLTPVHIDAAAPADILGYAPAHLGEARRWHIVCGSPRAGPVRLPP